MARILCSVDNGCWELMQSPSLLPGGLEVSRKLNVNRDGEHHRPHCLHHHHCYLLPVLNAKQQFSPKILFLLIHVIKSHPNKCAQRLHRPSKIPNPRAIRFAPIDLRLESDRQLNPPRAGTKSAGDAITKA